MSIDPPDPKGPPPQVVGQLEGSGALASLACALAFHMQTVQSMPLSQSDMVEAQAIQTDLTDTLKSILHI